MTSDLSFSDSQYFTQIKGQYSQDSSMFNTASTLGSPSIAVDELDLRKRKNFKQNYQYINQTTNRPNQMHKYLEGMKNIILCLAISAILTKQIFVRSQSVENLAQNDKQQEIITDMNASELFSNSTRPKHIQIIAAVPLGNKSCDYFNLSISSHLQQEIQPKNQSMVAFPLSGYIQAIIDNKDIYKDKFIPQDQKEIANYIEQNPQLTLNALVLIFLMFKLHQFLNGIVEYKNSDNQLFDSYYTGEMDTTLQSAMTPFDQVNILDPQTINESNSSIIDNNIHMKLEVERLQGQNDRFRNQIMEMTPNGIDLFNNGNDSDDTQKGNQHQEQILQLKQLYKDDHASWIEQKGRMEERYQKLKQISKFKKERADQLQHKIDLAEIRHQYEIVEHKHQLVEMAKSLSFIVNKYQQQQKEQKQQILQ